MDNHLARAARSSTGASGQPAADVLRIAHDRDHVLLCAPGGALRARQPEWQSNFIADVLDTDGNTIGLAANEIGKAPSDRVVRIPRDGIYLIEALADGAWTLNVSQ